MERRYYIYRHIRLDKNIPFYIGKGITTADAKSYKWEYRRAFYGTETRSALWKRIVEKTPYEVEVIYETINQDEIDKKEREFIKMYGRLDNKTGILCNHTDGGDGWSNPPKECIERAVKSRIASGGYEKCKISNSTKVYVYNFNGELVKDFKSIRHLHQETYMCVSTIWEYAKLKKSIYNYFISYSDTGININDYVIQKNESRPIAKINNSKEIVCLYKSRGVAIRKEKGSYTGYEAALKNGTAFRGFYWKYIDIFELKKHIDSGIIYIR